MRTFFVSDPALLIEVNLGFAISANSLDSQRTFQQMQDIIKATMENYPAAIIYYSVLSFGDPPVVHINFDDKMSAEDQRRTIDSIDKPSGKTSLDKALEKARSLFKDAAMKRPAAKNVLVVFVDRKSDSEIIDVKASSTLLEGDGVKVIIVGIGDEVDKREVDAVTSTSILTNTTDNPDSVAEEIIKNIDKGKEWCCSDKVFIKQLKGHMAS